MKNDIKPVYEDINNIKGGFYSLKVHQDNAFNIWKNLSIDLLTCNLEESKYNIINGLSIIKKILLSKYGYVIRNIMILNI